MSSKLLTIADVLELARRAEDVPEQIPAKAADESRPSKTPARPGSQWATGKRKNQKGFTAPKGFARGAKIK